MFTFTIKCAWWSMAWVNAQWLRLSQYKTKKHCSRDCLDSIVEETHLLTSAGS